MVGKDPASQHGADFGKCLTDRAQGHYRRTQGRCISRSAEPVGLVARRQPRASWPRPPGELYDQLDEPLQSTCDSIGNAAGGLDERSHQSVISWIVSAMSMGHDVITQYIVGELEQIAVELRRDCPL